MKFVMIKEFDWDLSKDKVIVGEVKRKYTVQYENGNKYERTSIDKVTIAYLLKMGDFNENNEYNILSNTDSIQIRPKAIYKSNKGYYKKIDNKRVFFNPSEVSEIEFAIEKFKKYLSEVEDDSSCSNER